MPKLQIAKNNLISRGCARYHDLLFLALRDKKLHKRNIAHTRLGSIDAGELASVADLKWNVVGMCVAKSPKEGLVAVGSSGDVFTYFDATEAVEQIENATDLRGCASISGLVHACGMGRQVFVRRGLRRWEPMHVSSSSNDIVGFEAIDGFHAEDIYAVGWEGEIWHFGGKVWIDCNSPVNVILSGICCAPDGNVYVCGQEGTFLRGRHDVWEILNTSDVEDDLWDVRWFNDRIYVVSMNYMYVLNGDELKPVEFGIDPPASFYKLTDAEGVLWSVGQAAILSFDGKTWQLWD